MEYLIWIMKLQIMSKNENEKANEILDVVSQIIDFNEQNQEGHGLKILTPQNA